MFDGLRIERGTTLSPLDASSFLGRDIVICMSSWDDAVNVVCVACNEAQLQLKTVPWRLPDKVRHKICPGLHHDLIRE